MTTKKELFLKVLDANMRSCNGGSQQWQIGKRITVKGKLEMCCNGIHLTLEPRAWRGRRVFIASTSSTADFQADGKKFVCRSTTLLMELSPKQQKAYEEGEASLWKAYKEGEAPLWKAYEEGEASLWKAYEEGEASLWKAYEEGKAPLWKAYEEGKASLWKAYKEGEASLWKAYKEKCQEILAKMLKGEKLK